MARNEKNRRLELGLDLCSDLTYGSATDWPMFG